MKTLVTILLAWLLVAHPIVAMGPSPCLCCEPAPAELDGVESSRQAPEAACCCTVLKGEPAPEQERPPLNPSERGGCDSCPKPCCLSAGPVVAIPATFDSISATPPIAWSVEYAQSYTSAPAPRLKRPPRASTLA